MAATTLLLKSLFCVFMACEFLTNFASSFDPMLTYTIRFKRIVMQPNITGNYTINQYAGKQYINAYVNIESNKVLDKLIAVFYRCNSEGVDCEYFQTWEIMDICNKLKEKNQLWSSLYGAFDPPMECPIDKVNYYMRNGTIDMGPVLVLYPDAPSYEWKVMQKFYAGDVFIGSYTVTVSIFGYRKRMKSILKG